MKRLFMALVAGFALAASQASAQPFETVAEMIEARAKATDADRKIARDFLTGAEAAARRGNWSGASKGYTEAAMFWPDAPALLGMATALAKMERSADGCENGYRVKLSDLSRAFQTLVLVQQLGEADGETHETGEVRGAIASAQQKVFAHIDACAGN